MKRFGTRQEVWEGECTMTRGGLTKDDLILSKSNRLVSKKKSEAAKAAYAKFGFKKRAPKEQKQVPKEQEQKQQQKQKQKPKRKRRRKKKPEAE